MRCPDCQKFVSLEMAEPQVDSDPEITYDKDVGGGPQISIQATVSIERTCGECSQTLKTATLEMERSLSVLPPRAEREKSYLDGQKGKRKKVPLPPDDPAEVAWTEHAASGCDSEDFSLDSGDPEATEQGGGRYAKSYYGAMLPVTITCDKCGWEAEVTLEDQVAASHMDEAV